MRRYRIGRADTNDVVLGDSTVSREHAELVELGEGRFLIKDLGSSYGIAISESGQWVKVTETELRHDTPLRIGDYETTVSDLMRDTDRTVVRPHAPPRAPEATAPPAPSAPRPAETAKPPTDALSQASEATAPPAGRRTHEPSAPPSPDRTATPQPAPPRPAPPRPAAPRPAPPRPAAPRPSAPRSSAPPRPAPAEPGGPPRPQPAGPAFQFMRNLPPDKRLLVWLGVGFAAFLLVAAITLILALAL